MRCSATSSAFDLIRDLEADMKKRKIKPNPLGEWLLNYVATNETNLTELSLSAGLSAGSVRQLVINPERQPTMETAIRLSELTGKPAEELLQMAGIDGFGNISNLSPDRIELSQRYQRLPTRLKFVLLTIARNLDEYAQKDCEVK
jgi:plasmid maintenance system antidote protein VapI